MGECDGGQIGVYADDCATEVERRIGFLHIPKTAGSSLVTLLRNHYGNAFAIFSIHDYFNFPQLFRSLPVVAGHIPYYVFEAARPGRVILTLLRSPVDRVVSHYKYILSTPGHFAHNYVRRYGLTLAEMLEHPTISNEGSNLQCRMLGWTPTKPSPSLDAEHDPRRRWQLFYEEHADYAYAEVDERCYATACRRLDDGSVVFGLLEEPHRAFSELHKVATGARLPRVVHENRTTDLGYRPTDRDIEAIMRQNEFDIRLYEHARALYAARARPSLIAVARSAFALLTKSFAES
jgi:hypothetical protein